RSRTDFSRVPARTICSPVASVLRKDFIWIVCISRTCFIHCGEDSRGLPARSAKFRIVLVPGTEFEFNCGSNFLPVLRVTIPKVEGKIHQDKVEAGIARHRYIPS